MMRHYKAPWGTTLIVVSSLATILCLGIPLGMLTLVHGVLLWVAFLPVALILGAALFTIRGYTITADAILVHRLLWATRLPLGGLQSTTVEPNVMWRSMRTCGNGGLFSFSGYYWNKSMGTYRAFVTDLRRTVVLRWTDRTVVLSPDLPDEFVRDLPIPANGRSGERPPTPTDTPPA